MNVDLLIIGAGRSGTTSVFKYLENHKQICFSDIKEIHYFSINDLYKRGLDYYHSFFTNCEKKKFYVSADTYLFIDKTAIRKIFDYNPNMKFIVMLRNPVERAFSGYNYAINNGYLNKNISFLQSIEKEKQILKKSKSIIDKNNLCNIYQSNYYYHLEEWTKTFPKKNFLLLQTSELKENTESLLNKISNFIGVSEFELVEDFHENSSKVVKSKRIEQFLLNRNGAFRRVLRNIVPNYVKQKIFKTGIVEKFHKLNKTDAEIAEITIEERSFAAKLFKKDLYLLNKYYGIKIK